MLNLSMLNSMFPSSAHDDGSCTGADPQEVLRLSANDAPGMNVLLTQRFCWSRAPFPANCITRNAQAIGAAKACITFVPLGRAPCFICRVRVRQMFTNKQFGITGNTLAVDVAMPRISFNQIGNANESWQGSNWQQPWRAFPIFPLNGYQWIMISRSVYRNACMGVWPTDWWYFFYMHSLFVFSAESSFEISN